MELDAVAACVIGGTSLKGGAAWGGGVGGAMGLFCCSSARCHGSLLNGMTLLRSRRNTS